MTARNVPFQSPRNHAEEIANARYLAAAYGLPELEAPKSPERNRIGMPIGVIAFSIALSIGLAVAVWRLV